MSLQQLYLAFLIGGLVLLVSIVGTRVATGVGFPSMLLFLLIGVAVGEDGFGLQFDDVEMARNIGTAALAVILVEGGLTTRFSDIRKVLAPATALATIGMVISTVITAVGAHLLLGIDWQLALLLGAIVSSTDAAAVFSVLRVLPLPQRVAGLLEAESGFNDAPTVILVLMFSVVPFAFDPAEAVTVAVYELLAGAGIGLAVGYLGALALRRIALPDRDLRVGAGRVRRRRRRPRQRFHRRIPGRGGPGQFGAAAQVGDPLVRRRVRLVGPDRPVRAPRTAGQPQRAGG
jgi:cell volume regulation protein A